MTAATAKRTWRCCQGILAFAALAWLCAAPACDRQAPPTNPVSARAVSTFGYQIIGEIRTLVVLEIEGDKAIPQPSNYYDGLMSRMNANILRWSGGKAWLSWRISGWNRTPWGLCGSTDWRDYLDSGVNPNDFDKVVLVLVGALCGGTGGEAAPFSRYVSVAAGVGAGTLHHEFFHALGLAHANECMNWPSCSTVYDYFDTTSIMGMPPTDPDSHPPTAGHLERLGWIAPREIVGSPGQSVTVPLDLYEQTGDAVKVRRNAWNWLWIERRGSGLHVTTLQPGRTAGSLWVGVNPPLTDPLTGTSLRAASDGVTVTLGEPDTIPPVLTWESPLASQGVAGTVHLDVAVSDDRGVASLTFSAGSWSRTLTAPPWATDWDVSGLSDGRACLLATARDAAGNETSVQRCVYVTNTSGPSSTLSLVPNVLICPDASLEYAVTVKDVSGHPMPGASVRLVFSPDADATLAWCTGTAHPIMSATADAGGRAVFRIGAGGWLPAGPEPAVTVSANGVALRGVGVVSLDLDGDGKVGLADAVALGRAIKTNAYWFPADLNSDGACDLVDAMLLTGPAKRGASCR